MGFRKCCKGGVELGIQLSKLQDKAEFSHKEGWRRWFAVDYGPVLIAFPHRSTIRYNYDFYRNDCTLFGTSGNTSSGVFIYGFVISLIVYVVYMIYLGFISRSSGRSSIISQGQKRLRKKGKGCWGDRYCCIFRNTRRIAFRWMQVDKQSCISQWGWSLENEIRNTEKTIPRKKLYICCVFKKWF